MAKKGGKVKITKKPRGGKTKDLGFDMGKSDKGYPSAPGGDD